MLYPGLVRVCVSASISVNVYISVLVGVRDQVKQFSHLLLTRHLNLSLTKLQQLQKSYLVPIKIHITAAAALRNCSPLAYILRVTDFCFALFLKAKYLALVKPLRQKC